MSFADVLGMIAALVLFVFALLEVAVRWVRRIKHIAGTPYEPPLKQHQIEDRFLFDVRTILDKCYQRSAADTHLRAEIQAFHEDYKDLLR